ncbi:hypothetical protein HAX54_049411, partial [Datura stramonium]|nr:hypothetical protein [Datura stramonium]
MGCKSHPKNTKKLFFLKSSRYQSHCCHFEKIFPAVSTPRTATRLPELQQRLVGLHW